MGINYGKTLSVLGNKNVHVNNKQPLESDVVSTSVKINRENEEDLKLEELPIDGEAENLTNSNCDEDSSIQEKLSSDAQEKVPDNNPDDIREIGIENEVSMEKEIENPANSNYGEDSRIPKNLSSDAQDKVLDNNPDNIREIWKRK